MYEVVFSSRFERTFKKLDKLTQQIILDAVAVLARNPFDTAQIKKIVGVKQNAFRLRVGRWRILYIVLTKQERLEVVDLFIRRGRDDYRDL